MVRKKEGRINISRVGMIKRVGRANLRRERMKKMSWMRTRMR